MGKTNSLLLACIRDARSGRVRDRAGPISLRGEGFAAGVAVVDVLSLVLFLYLVGKNCGARRNCSDVSSP